MQLISRAVVLLRIATGACSQLLGSARLSKPDLQFWWEQLVEVRGLWNQATRPSDITDLWADAADAMSQLDDWGQRNGAGATYARWRSDCAREISTLGTCERIGLWGLGL